VPPLKEQPLVVINTHSVPGFAVVQSMGITPFLCGCVALGWGAIKNITFYDANFVTYCQQYFQRMVPFCVCCFFQEGFWGCCLHPITLERLLHVYQMFTIFQTTILGVDLLQILNSKER
jgi:hypothetical protein